MESFHDEFLTNAFEYKLFAEKNEEINMKTRRFIDELV